MTSDDELYKIWWYAVLYGASPTTRMQMVDAKRGLLPVRDFICGTVTGRISSSTPNFEEVERARKP